MYLQEIVSVPYWGSNYLMGVGKSTTIGLIVSVPYWGSNYLMKMTAVGAQFRHSFRPLLGF